MPPVRATYDNSPISVSTPTLSVKDLAEPVLNVNDFVVIPSDEPSLLLQSASPQRRKSDPGLDTASAPLSRRGSQSKKEKLITSGSTVPTKGKDKGSARAVQVICRLCEEKFPKSELAAHHVYS